MNARHLWLALMIAGYLLIAQSEAQTLTLDVGTGRIIDFDMHDNGQDVSQDWHGVIRFGVEQRFSSTVRGVASCEHRSSVENNRDDGINFCGAYLRFRY